MNIPHLGWAYQSSLLLYIQQLAVALVLAMFKAHLVIEEHHEV